MIFRFLRPIFIHRILPLMKRYLLFIAFVSLALSLPGFAKRFTHGFRLAKLRLEFPCRPEWEVDLTQEVKAILSQPYSFIGKGAQCYVFASQDQKYVIKLFRYDQPSIEEKIVFLFDACKMAYDKLPEETGLIYIHLNQTRGKLPVLCCTDAVFRSYRIPLDDYRFALQKKGEPLRETLEAALNDPVQIKQRIDSFLSLLQARTEADIYNADSNLSRNFGFLEDRAIEFDFGNYRYCPGLDRPAEIRRYADKLRTWLKKNGPEWIDYLDQRLETL